MRVSSLQLRNFEGFVNRQKESRPRRNPATNRKGHTHKNPNKDYQVDGVVVEDLVGGELCRDRVAGRQVRPVARQALRVQLLALRQTVVEALVQHRHHLFRRNGDGPRERERGKREARSKVAKPVP